MKVFNDICFDDYSDKIDNMVENHIKIKDKEGITISAYSYNNDYLNNFDKLIKINNINYNRFKRIYKRI